MEHIFLSVIHLATHEASDETAFAEMLQQLKDDLESYDNEGVAASITVVAETGLFSCEIAIGVSCENDHFCARLNKLADTYRGTCYLQESRRA
ncbi:MAG: hypothetical protein KF744_00180 [Taibaiella sp.]|nr:hypothetical protein [Taibaiella sp.]